MKIDPDIDCLKIFINRCEFYLIIFAESVKIIANELFYEDNIHMTKKNDETVSGNDNEKVRLLIKDACDNYCRIDNDQFEIL